MIMIMKRMFQSKQSKQKKSSQSLSFSSSSVHFHFHSYSRPSSCISSLHLHSSLSLRSSIWSYLFYEDLDKDLRNALRASGREKAGPQQNLQKSMKLHSFLQDYLNDVNKSCRKRTRIYIDKFTPEEKKALKNAPIWTKMRYNRYLKNSVKCYARPVITDTGNTDEIRDDNDDNNNNQENDDSSQENIRNNNRLLKRSKSIVLKEYGSSNSDTIVIVRIIVNNQQSYIFLIS
ncbi:hypothetical protein GLOIN_2v1765153 [Rhizophagus clarus]|uniref:Uncharacterized protein n=1 Tax=Rhizophagus clarus TaxID=94130 RepID=A0A8H3M1V7_9GLOM|nr:hypothetical protein GLOIN_2v1765153 [Rhizophagus clarus]